MQGTIHDIYFNTQRQFEAKTKPVTDEELLLEYRESGDRELYAQLVYRYERELFSYLRRYMGNAEMAEDVFQTAFLQVHLKCDLFDAGRRFRPWLYTIATNAAIDAKRRNKRHKTVSLDTPREQDNEDVGRLVNLLESSDPNPSESALSVEREQLVRETLNQLPESMSTLIQLVYYQGLKYREAAEVLDIPVGTVKSRIHSAIAKLTDAWNTSRID
ncbi:sigma-70 family RNA polymerase sigma factor [bacterium]|nr:sigma-70 family RNA polymerase sigma factor [bacterium]